VTLLVLSALFFGGADFDLDTLRTSLDEKGLEIAANQDGSLKSRKRLADFTKGVVMVFRLPVEIRVSNLLVRSVGSL